VSVPVGRRSRASGPPDLHRLASYGRHGRDRRRFPLLPLLGLLVLAGVGAGGFFLGRLTAPEPEPVVVVRSPGPVQASVTSVLSAPVTAAVVHEIKQGENLQQIADLYGVTQAQLIAFNQILDPNKIFWGLRLRIPPVDWEPPATTVAPVTTAAPATAAP
jgi:LysM repeat protein